MKTKLLSKKLKNPTQLNTNGYTKYNTLYTRLLRITKKIYFNEKLECAKGNMKQTWSTLRNALNINTIKEKLPDYFNIENNKITDKQTIANHFNTYFSNIGKDISNNVPISEFDYLHYMKTPTYKHNMFLDPVNPLDIIETTSKLKAKTSQGHDQISCKLMKDTIAHIALPLSHIINQSLSTGTVPKQMKIAKVIPIFKSGDKYTFNNYRPISILPAFSKILEQIMATKLLRYFDKYNLVYKHQYGFRPKHSTMHPIIQLLNQITNENDKASKNLTLSVFIDLSKAFDNINHDILLKKLNNLGIRGIANLWFKSYLSDRNQYMVINDVTSSMEKIACGVPQGSILGPILFLIYVNDISNSCELNILSFADDTTASFSESDVTLLCQKVNLELAKLNDWFCANKLSLNAKKTKYILFRPTVTYPDLRNRHIMLNGHPVDRIGNNQKEKSFKFLGIHIDETLTWKHHIEKVSSKISRANYMISKVKKVLPKSSLKTLYSSLIHSHIHYGLIIWG